MDRVSKEQRHYNMSQIHGSDTKPEIIVRKYLYQHGLRYRKNDKRLPGHPDIVLPKYKTVVFVNGCFWHGHNNCKYAKMPLTNSDFWRAKILSNQIRDKKVISELSLNGWRVITVWQCELKKEVETETLESVLKAITKQDDMMSI